MKVRTLKITSALRSKAFIVWFAGKTQLIFAIHFVYYFDSVTNTNIALKFFPLV